MAHRYIPEPQLLPTDYTKLKNSTIRKNLKGKVRFFLREWWGIPYPWRLQVFCSITEDL
jgi:hypothetical protein